MLLDCAKAAPRLRTGPIMLQIPRGYAERKSLLWLRKTDCALIKKPPFLALDNAPAKKDPVRDLALKNVLITQGKKSLRKAALVPAFNGNANAILSLSGGKKPHFFPRG